MAETLILSLSVLRALVEVAGWFLLGRGILYVLAGQGRQRNAIYRFFVFLTSPVIAVVRAMAPNRVPDGAVPVLGFFILLGLWIGLALLRREICLASSMTC